MIVGDIEYQIGWEKDFIGKGDKIDAGKRDMFFAAVKHSMWDITEQSFNIMFPKFKVSWKCVGQLNLTFFRMLRGMTLL